MKNILRKSFIIPLLALCSGFLMVSCSDWTDTESLKIKEAQPGQSYQRYLEDLRQYRKTDHRIVYAWFDNPQIAMSMGNCLTAIPDSVDIINLLNPANLPDWTQRQMNTVQEDKGMKVIYTVSYVNVEDEYGNYVKTYSGEVEDMESLSSFLSTYMNMMMPLCSQYGYDGISFRYDGMVTLHLSQAEIEEYEANQTEFMSQVEAWVTANPDKMFIFEGNPENLLDKSILNKADYIVLRSEKSANTYALSNAVIVASQTGVPTDRFIVAVSTQSLDDDDDTTGVFYDAQGNSVSAIPLAAEWVVTQQSGMTKKGLGIYDIQNDYYNTYLNYQNTRAAIFTMNPSPKY